MGHSVWIHNISPILFSYGPVSIRYYGLLYVIGFLFSFWFLRRAMKQGRIQLSQDQVLDLTILSIIGVIVGGRLGYVLFYDLNYFLTYPFEVIAIWNGGMSFHGALLGVILMGIFYCQKEKLSFYQIADIIVIPVSFILIFGRLVNFINGELYGKLTQGDWGVIFPGTEQPRHPSQLYESIKNLLIFGILWIIYQKKRYTAGLLFWLFLFLYGSLRFIVEFWREPEIVFGMLSMGQWLSLIMIIISIFYIYVTHKSHEKSSGQ